MSHLSKKVLGAGAAMVALSAFVPNPFLIGEAMAQATASDTMNITAKVVNPLGVNQITKLDFGSFAVTAAAGKITQNAQGAVTTTNVVVVAAAADGKVSFTAPKSATFTIAVTDLTDSKIVLKNGAGASSKSTLTVDQIFLKAGTSAKLTIAGGTAQTTLQGPAATKVTAKVIDAGGVGAADLGGRLNTKANNIVGSYTGTYAMSTTF